MALAIQDALEGKYEILEKIGEGGIGAVYKVRHRLLQEVRVIKVLRPQAASKEDLQERFVHEARMAIRLKQPNIAQLHDFAVTKDGTAYIVMEFIDGVGLDALLRACGPPSIDLALEISRQALTALGYLHAHRFVHRDVSPDNLMLTRAFDGHPAVKLIDLGIAKNLESGMQLTATGVFVGKVRYSSPEQFSAQGGGDEIDHRSDIYSFGVLLYELLTGHMPVEGESFSEIAGGHLFHPPRPFEETDPDGRLAPELRAAVLKALEKEPDKRYESTEEMIAALEPFRDPAAGLADEAERGIVATRESSPALAAARKAGSTQNRLDAEFGLATTPTPTLLAKAADEETTATPTEDLRIVAGNIDNLIRAGKLRQAQKALAKAVQVFGRIRPLADLADRLAAARGRSPAAGLAGVKWLPWAAVLVALAAAGGGWLAFRGGGGRTATATDGAELAATVDWPPPPPRWSPEAVPDQQPLANRGPAEPPPFTDAGAPPPVPATSEPPPGAGEPTGDPTAGPRLQGPPPDAQRPPPGGQPAGPPPPGAGGGPPPPTSTTTDIYQPGEVGVMPPVLLSLPPAVYPLDRPPRQDVVYVVTVLVDELGRPLNPSIKRGSAFRRKVRDAAIEVAMGARFRPATKNGVAGRMWKDVQVVFAGSE